MAKKNILSKINMRYLVWALVVAVLFSAAFYLINNMDGNYVGVQMASGNMYFGRLTSFPKLVLHDVHVIQAFPSEDPTGQPQLTTVPLSTVVVWGPDSLELNRSQIMYISKLTADSEVLKVIKQSE